jgi:hypothetical protein
MQAERFFEESAPGEIERFYTISEIAERWKVHVVTVRHIFRGRKGVMQLAPRGPWRIPASLVNAVMKERELRDGESRDGDSGQDS